MREAGEGLDAWGDAEVVHDVREASDGYHPPDAFVPPPEVCNGVDDDLDTLVDESTSDCALAPDAESAVCLSGGVCACRAEGTPVHTGDQADCNADWSDGCETPLGTATDCARCGEVCDAVSTCSETEAGGFACRPIGILDFSISHEDGEITCVVAVDHRVFCRGPNTEHAISETADETVTLGWTLVGLPEANEVRTNLRVRDDGREVLSICAITTMGQVVCRGDNGTGLLGYGDTLPRPGNHVVPLPADLARVEMWGGDAYAMVVTTPGYSLSLHTLWRWGGPEALAPVVWLERVWELGTGHMPMAGVAVPTTPTWDSMELFSWGPHRDGLAFEPDSAAALTGPTSLGAMPPWIACSRDVCCVETTGPSARCWGSGVVRWSGGSELPNYFNRAAVLSAGGLVWEDFWAPRSATASNIRMAPGPGGAETICVGSSTEVGWVPDTPRAALACGDAVELARSAPGVTVPSRPEPDMIRERDPEHPSGMVARSRVDWDAMCLPLTPDHWQCWGMHPGWGHPPIP